MQESLQPLFERQGVKGGFSGHDHAYERTLVNGVTYVVAGGGGVSLHGQSNLQKSPDSLVFKKAYHFVQVDVTFSKMKLTAWEVDQAGARLIIDQTTLSP